MNAYFSQNGLEYTIGRVPMASCDFSTREYSYLDTPEDYALAGFKLAEEDYKYKIPYIKEALNLTRGNIALFASPWSAPGWMKDTGRMKGTGALRNDSKVHKAYADYFVRYQLKQKETRSLDSSRSTPRRRSASGGPLSRTSRLPEPSPAGNGRLCTSPAALNGSSLS